MKTPAFTNLVFDKAWADTKRSFSSLKRDSIIGVVSVIFGFSIYWYFRGLPTAIDQAASFLIFTFGPLALVVATVFLWNLWLAPAQLAYEAINEISISLTSMRRTSGIVPKKDPPVINWSIWKHRAKYTVGEFAAILAKTDPASSSVTLENASFQKLIEEEMNADKLAYVKRYWPNPYGGTKREYNVDEDTELTKEDAIEWARAKNFPVTLIE